MHTHVESQAQDNFFFPPKIVSVCDSSGCLGTSSVTQAGLELTAIYLSLPPKPWATTAQPEDKFWS